MEQKDSLREELKNLANLQLEQIKVLNDIKNGDQTRENMRQAEKQRMSAEFDKSSMYKSSSMHSYQPGSTSHLFNPFPNPAMQGMNMNAIYNGNGFIDNAASLVGKNNQYGFWGTMNPGTSSSTMARTLTNMDFSTRVSKAGITGVGAAGSLGSTMLGSAIAPGVAGLALGVTGGLAIGAATGVVTDELDKNTALKKYLYKNSSMFIDPTESKNDRGVAGFSRSETNDAADFVRKMNDEFYMQDEEVMQLLQSFTEGGMLKSSTDLDSFKEKMLSLTKTVKEGALILNETYDSIADLLSEMRKAGIDQKNFEDLMGMSNIIGSMNGTGGSETIRNILDFVKSLNAGTPNNGDLTTSRVETTTLYMSDYYNKLEANDKRDHNEEANYNMIKNLGGAAEAAKHLQVQLEKIADSKNMNVIGNYAFDWDKDKSEWKFNKDKYNELLTTNKSLGDITETINKKFTALTDEGQGEAILKWNREQGTYLRNNLKDGELTDLIYKTVKIFKNDEALKGQNLSEETILDQFFGVKDVGTQKLLNGFMTHQIQNPFLKRQADIQNMWQKKVTSVEAQTPSFSELLGSGFEKGKDFLTQGFVNIDNALGEGIQSFMDFIYQRDKKIGPKPEETFNTRSDLKSIGSEEVERAMKQTNEVLASTYDTLKGLADKGFTVDKEVMNSLEGKLIGLEKSVEYSRDVITDWDKVDKDIRDNKNTIQDLAEKNDLSETIVASLHKYNQSKPNNEKIDVSKTVETLGNNMVQYGGNNALALAATLGGNNAVDSGLLGLNYDIEKLRKYGAQEAVQNINVNDIGLGEDLTKKVTEMLSQQIGNINVTGGGVSTSGAGAVPEDVLNMRLDEKVNVSADQLNKWIDKMVVYQERATGRTSTLRGQGQIFLDAQEKTGVNAIYLASHAGSESRWGTSDITRAKNNYFGIGAYDASPMTSAYTFKDTKDGIFAGAEWISKNYINSDKHKQNTLNRMRYSDSGTHNYATDNVWHNTIGDIMKGAYKDMGNVTMSPLEYSDPEQVGVKKVQVKKYVDGDTHKTAGEIMDGASSMFKDTGTIIDKLSKLVDNVGSSKDKGNISLEDLKKDMGLSNNATDKDILNQLSNTYETLMKGMNNYLDGNKDSNDYKYWENKSAGDKRNSINLIEALLGSEEFRNYRKEIGIGVREKHDISENKEKLFTKNEIQEMKKIDKEGVYRGNARNDISDSEAIDRLETYKKTQQKSQGAEETEKRYALANEGFQQETGRSKALGNFVEVSGGPKTTEILTTDNIRKNMSSTIRDFAANNNKFAWGDDGGVFKKSLADHVLDFSSLVTPGGASSFTGGTDAVRSRAASFMDTFIAEMEKTLKGGTFNDIKTAIESNKDLSGIGKEFMGMFKDRDQGAQLLKEAAEQLLASNKEGKKGSDELNYDLLKKFGNEVMGMNLQDYKGDIKAYNADLNKGINSFYKDNMQAYEDFINGRDTKDASRWKDLDASEKGNMYDTLKLLGDALGFNKKGSEGKTIEKIEKEQNKKVDDRITGSPQDMKRVGKESIYTEEEREKMKYIHQSKDGKYYYDSAKVNEDATYLDFEKWQKQGGERIQSSDALTQLMEIEKSLKIGDGDDLRSKSSQELIARLEQNIEKVASELMKTANEVQEASSKLFSQDSINKTIDGEGLFKLNKNEKQIYQNALNSGDEKLLETFKGNLKSELEDIAQMVNEGDVTGLKKLMENMKKDGREINHEAFEKLLKLAEKIGDVEVEGLMGALDSINKFSERASDISKTSLLVRGATESDGRKTSDTIKYDNEMKKEILSSFSNEGPKSSDLQELIKEIQKSNGDMNKVFEALMNPESKNFTTEELEKLSNAISSANEKSLKEMISGSNEMIEKLITSDVWKNSKAGDEKIQVEQKTSTQDGKAVEKAEKVEITVDQALVRMKELNKAIEENKGKNSELTKKLQEDKQALTTEILPTFLEGMQEMGKITEESGKLADEAKANAESTAKTFADSLSKYDAALSSAIKTLDGRVADLEGKYVNYGNPTRPGGG